MEFLTLWHSFKSASKLLKKKRINKRLIKTNKERREKGRKRVWERLFKKKKIKLIDIIIYESSLTNLFFQATQIPFLICYTDTGVTKRFLSQSIEIFYTIHLLLYPLIATIYFKKVCCLKWKRKCSQYVFSPYIADN